MTEHFFKGFEKRAAECAGIDKKAFAALGVSVLKALSKPIMAIAHHPGKALTVGLGASDVLAGTRKGMQYANAGMQAKTLNNMAGAIV
jgi:hypothetical protein